MGVRQKELIKKIKIILEDGSMQSSDCDRIIAIDSAIKIYEEKYSSFN